ncbi:MAG: thymidine kinase [Bacteroidetes bacterium]|nr:thymidine kinase [Bacteroidota bacterium]MCL6102378.1 thymidine kinase [Bacteroidota bacterium]
MFIESNLNNGRKRGWIEVIVGSMFSGKTEELIRRLRRAEIAKQHVEIFKPTVDTRYSASEVVSHNENSIRSTAIDNSSTILLLSGNIDVIGIDEAQFFDENLVEVCNKLANMGIRVIVAGLDMDFRGEPFGPMPGLMACAEFVTKVHAVCMRCGHVAQFSHRLSDGGKIVMLGEKESYEPLCRECFRAINPQT